MRSDDPLQGLIDCRSLDLTPIGSNHMTRDLQHLLKAVASRGGNETDGNVIQKRKLVIETIAVRPRVDARPGYQVPLVDRQDQRSEEHTSELQSLTNIVCRLLLEKKKD